VQRIDFKTILAVTEELEELVTNEPQLAEFEAAVRQVRKQAYAVTMGIASVPVLRKTTQKTLKDRALAERILTIVNRFPMIDPDVHDPESVRIASTLLGNCVVAITHAIFASFPELMREAN
jgi:hypothetical protein